MKIYIDSADLDQIREAFSWGIVDGITTNPSLIKQAAQKHLGGGSSADLDAYIRRILELAGPERPVSLEVIASDRQGMERQGRFLHETYDEVANNVVVKVPINPNIEVGGESSYEGLQVIAALARDGIAINTTLVFTPEQAMLAAKAGARYVSPFAGRIDDLLRQRAGQSFDKGAYFPAEGRLEGDGDEGIVSGVHLVESTVQLFEAQALTAECEVLAASLRNPRQVRECAMVGSDIATIPFAVLRQMAEHEKTAEGMRAFIADVVPEYEGLFES